MSEQENKQELRKKLIRARDIEEVRAILGPETAEEEINQTWREIEAHRPADGLEAVDDDELEAVSGGMRDWEEEGCTASVEEGSHCWSDDACFLCESTYYNVDRCTDGYKHDWHQIGWDKTTYPRFLGGNKYYRVYKCKKCNKEKQVEY